MTLLTSSHAQSSLPPAAEAAGATAISLTNPPHQIRQKYPMEKAKRIDVASRIIFPLVFAVFNLAYWSTYLLQARNEFLAALKKTNQ